jgi:Phosphatidylinositol-4-phosphate 5-Kinase
MASPGKSGSVFFLSDDDRFLIKTVRREEMKMLLDFVPAYYSHVRLNSNTLLTQFYGVHRVTILPGRNVSAELWLASRARQRVSRQAQAVTLSMSSCCRRTPCPCE